jgi:threonine aldolase
VETNILFIELDLEAARLDAYALMAGMREGGVIANASSPTTMRLVTHLDVSRAQVEQAAEVICHLLG